MTYSILPLVALSALVSLQSTTAQTPEDPYTLSFYLPLEERKATFYEYTKADPPTRFPEQTIDMSTPDPAGPKEATAKPIGNVKFTAKEQSHYIAWNWEKEETNWCRVSLKGSPSGPATVNLVTKQVGTTPDTGGDVPMIHFECGPQFATNAADAAAAVDSDESEPAIPTSNPDEASANQIDTEPTPVDVPNIMVNSSNDPEAKLSESVTLTFFAHKENATVGQEYWHDTTNYTDKELEANPNLIFFNSEKLDPPAKDEPVQLGRMTYSNQLMDRPREFTWWGKDSTALNPINCKVKLNVVPIELEVKNADGTTHDKKALKDIIVFLDTGVIEPRPEASPATQEEIDAFKKGNAVTLTCIPKVEADKDKENEKEEADKGKETKP